MSEFTFPCPLCNQDILCDDQYHGQQLQCPICQGEITAPEAEAKPTGSLGIKMTGSAKHTPIGPRFQKPVVTKKKSNAGKIVTVTATVLVILVALFFVARFTGLSSHLPAFLGGRSPATAEGTSTESTTAPGQSAATTESVTPTAEPPPPPAPIVWMTNLANAVIPTNAAHGQITTNEFTYDNARIDNGILALRQGKDSSPDLELGVIFGLKPGESLSGKSIDVAADARLAPRVWKRWKVQGKQTLQAKQYTKGYAMKLQFGEVMEDKVPGKIYICLPDEDQSVVAGSFVASVGSGIATQPSAQPTAPASSQQMSEDMRKRYGVRAPGRP